VGTEQLVTPLEVEGADPSAIAGYTIVLPPGWCRIPVRQGSAKAIRGLLDDVLSAVPANVSRDRVAQYRVELEGRLKKMVADARAKGGVDLYLPVVPVHGVPVGASFLVSEGTIPARDADPARLVAHLASAGDGKPVTVDGSPAARTEHVAPAEAAAELDSGTTRVDYIISVPGAPDRWLLVAFSTFGAGTPGDEFSGVLVQLFDAIMSTFRWSRA
jgi:hypothetical protein